MSGYADSISYHANGMMHQLTHSNQVVDAIGLDPVSMARPSSISTSGVAGGLGWSTGTYQYDGAGNIVAMGNDRYSSDGLSRLVQAHMEDVDRDSLVDSLDWRYAYDAFGNRLEVLRAVEDETGALSSSWVTTLADQATNRLAASTYDATGNMLDLHGDTFRWYPFNRMWTREGLGRSYIYGYDADGERTAIKDHLADSYRFTIRDLDNRVILELIFDSGTYRWEKDWIHAGGKLIALEDANGTKHYHVDHLGTPRLVTDANGNRVTFNSYSSFGLQVAGSGENRLQFTGHERDPGNLDYMHARYYSARSGRFLNVDPIGGKQGSSQFWALFSYVSNEPARLSDPAGLAEWDSSQRAWVDEITVAATEPRWWELWSLRQAIADRSTGRHPSEEERRAHSGNSILGVAEEDWVILTGTPWAMDPSGGGVTIEMWVNRVKKVIESAWPTR